MVAKHQVADSLSPILRGRVNPIKLYIWISEIPELTLKEQLDFGSIHFDTLY